MIIPPPNRHHRHLSFPSSTTNHSFRFRGQPRIVRPYDPTSLFRLGRRSTIGDLLDAKRKGARTIVRTGSQP